MTNVQASLFFSINERDGRALRRPSLGTTENKLTSGSDQLLLFNPPTRLRQDRLGGVWLLGNRALFRSARTALPTRSSEVLDFGAGVSSPATLDDDLGDEGGVSGEKPGPLDALVVDDADDEGLIYSGAFLARTVPEKIWILPFRPSLSRVWTSTVSPTWNLGASC